MMEITTAAWIGLGSNLDDPERHVRHALGELAGIERTRVAQHSRCYRSAPWGNEDQPDFINAVALVDTQLDALVLLEALMCVERMHGRHRDGARWGPRVLDLDLLVYGTERIDDDRLVVPHPRIAERAFVLRPMADIDPQLSIPGLGAVSDLLTRIDTSGCIAID